MGVHEKSKITSVARPITTQLEQLPGNPHHVITLSTDRGETHYVHSGDGFNNPS